MRYTALAGGKRIRPVLVYATAIALGAKPESVDPIAAAVELIHCYSLVHDDLPAMDDDDLRRGKPSCHKAFDEATAILVGDALQSFAFQLISEFDHPDISATQKLQLISRLTAAIGSQGMAGGQALDMAATKNNVSLAQLEQIHALKTGALINASVLMGATAANCHDKTLLKGLNTYANALGLAFQIQDDILDVTGSDEQLGKPQGSDHLNQKMNFASLLGIEAAQEKVYTLHQEANDAVAPLQKKAEVLLFISDFLRERVC